MGWPLHRCHGVQAHDIPRCRLQTEETAAVMARAWLALPQDVREKGWPEFEEATGRVAFFGRR